MINITLKADLKAIEDFYKLVKDFRVEVIENSLDEPLSQSIEDLKSTLTSIVSSVGVISQDPDEVRPNQTKTAQQTTYTTSRFESDDNQSRMRKSSKDLIEYLTGLDLDNLPNPNALYTKNTQSNVFFITDDGLIKYRHPVNEYSTYDSDRLSVTDRMKTSLLVDSKGNIYLPKPNLVSPRPNCSNQPGDHDRSKQVYESRKNSLKQHRQDSIQKTGYPYVEWTMFKGDTQQLINSSLNLRTVIDKIEEGDIDSALGYLRSVNQDKLITDITEKVENIGTKDKDVPQNVQAFTNIQELINGLKLLKRIGKEEVTYQLITDYSGEEDAQYKNFFDELQRQIGLWIITNEDKWFNDMVKSAQKVIQKFESKG